MADIDIYSSNFVARGMVLGVADKMTAEWGANLANNTGYLAAQPVSVWHCHLSIGSDADAGHWEDIADFIFLSTGTWTIYYSMAGTYTAGYYGSGFFAHYFPDLYIAGSKYITGQGTWSNKSGSFRLVSSGEAIPVELRCDGAADATRICGYITLYGLRDSGVLS